MVDWTDEAVLEAKVAPLEDWAVTHAEDEDCEESIELIELNVRRMRRNPAKAAGKWKQLLAEGEYYDDWPIGGKGNSGNLHPVIRAIALQARNDIGHMAKDNFEDSTFLKAIKLKRPRDSDPLFYNAVDYAAAQGQSAYTAIVNLHKAGFLTVEGGIEGLGFDTYDPKATGDTNGG